MIEYKTFEDGPEEAARFTASVWHPAFGGKVIIPIWTGDYFDWELFAGRRGGDEDYLIGAYHGGKLIGTLFAEEFDFYLHGRVVRGGAASWLAVAHDYRDRDIAKNMYKELQKRLLKRGAHVLMGWFLRPRKGRVGHKFWSQNSNLVDIDDVGCWARLLEHQACARWETSRTLGLLSGALGLVQGPPKVVAPTDGIRSYEYADVTACRELVDPLMRQQDFGYVWTTSRLNHQLQYKKMPRTLVAERDGRVAGFLNYYPLKFLGREPLQGAMIDLAVLHTLPPKTSRRLVATALTQMREEGIAFVITLRTHCQQGHPFALNGFIPMPPQTGFGIILVNESFDLGRIKTYYAHVR